MGIWKNKYFIVITAILSMIYSLNGFADSTMIPSLMNAQTHNQIDKADMVTHFTDGIYYPDEKNDGLNCMQARKNYTTNADAKGLYHLAQLSFIGCQVKADTKLALVFYEQSAKQGSKEAAAMLKLIDQQGASIAQSLLMTVQHIQNQAHQGNAKAQYQLAMLSLYNHHLQTSMDWLEKSARQGYLPAQYQLGSFYFMGITGRADPVKGVEVWEKIAATNPVNQDHAVKQAIIDANVMLGQIYFAGRDGIAKDLKRFFHYYEQAAELGNKEAMHYIAMMYQQGKGVEKNLEQSQLWFEKLKQ
ncbi:unnamed protein product [Commensalibacter communis]|nr:unnamed protein product [Commensalibacter communis]CAI3953833.1 unnamed protein product [Commensalibacter communis]